MARQTVQIEGLDRLKRQLEALAPELEAAAKKAVKEAADAVKEQTRQNVRVDTGNLRDEVDIEYKDDGMTATVGWKNRKDWYATVQEHGTSRIPAQPALGPALEAERARFEERLRQEVRRVLR